MIVIKPLTKNYTYTWSLPASDEIHFMNTFKNMTASNVYTHSLYTFVLILSVIITFVFDIFWWDKFSTQRF